MDLKSFGLFAGIGAVIGGYALYKTLKEDSNDDKIIDTTATVVNKKTLKLFASVPMRDKSEDEIERSFKTALENVKKLYPDNNIILIESYKSENKNKSAIDSLGNAIKEMNNADIVYFCKGWQDARGCVIEHDVATKYGKKCHYE